MKRYRFRMPIGDWSCDGHGRCDWYLCEANKPIEAVREAHFKITEVTNINIEKICSDYDDNSISSELYENLRELGFVAEENLNEYIMYLYSADMATLWVLLLNKADPELKIELVNEDGIPMLPFYSFDQKNRHISFVGYGTV